MTPATRKQVKVRVEPELSAQLKRYCAAHNCTEQALMRTALEQFLAGTNDRAVLMRRLDLVALELQKLETASQLVGEALGAFVLVWLTHNPELPDEHKGAARRQALRRYELFQRHVLRAVGDGRTLLAQLLGGPVLEPAAQETAT